MRVISLGDGMNKADLLRQKILAEVKQLEVLQMNPSKDDYRALHAPAVRMMRQRSHDWVRWKYPKYESFFANGCDVQPEKIQPKLIEVTKPWHADLFRLARLTWSLPFTKGFGRRLRFLIVDESNDKLMGVLGLQSPPLDLPARDQLFNYPEDRKVEFINQTMDIFTLGALPPYGRLLGGKLVAMASASDEVRQAYQRKYQGRITEMDQNQLPARLVAMTSISAFGRSSLYNRIKYKDRWVAKSVGFTQGYGSFHLAGLYPLMREFLEAEGVCTRGGFGKGPRIVWQTCTRTFDHLGLPRELLKHGIKREVFLFPLIWNLEEFMNGQDHTPCYFEQSFDELADWWRHRWLLPRAQRIDGWQKWDHQNLEHILNVTLH